MHTKSHGNAHSIQTRSPRPPLPFHRKHQTRSYFLRPGRIPRRSPRKVPCLRSLRLQPPLHRQDRNRNLSRLKTSSVATSFSSTSFFVHTNRDLIRACRLKAQTRHVILLIF